MILLNYLLYYKKDLMDYFIQEKNGLIFCTLLNEWQNSDSIKSNVMQILLQLSNSEQFLTKLNQEWEIAFDSMKEMILNQEEISSIISFWATVIKYNATLVLHHLKNEKILEILLEESESTEDILILLEYLLSQDQLPPSIIQLLQKHISRLNQYTSLVDLISNYLSF